MKQPQMDLIFINLSGSFPALSILLASTMSHKDSHNLIMYHKDFFLFALNLMQYSFTEAH